MSHTITTPSPAVSAAGGRRRRALPVLLAAVSAASGLAAAGAGPAQADSFAFRNGEDAEIINADGSRRELVVDGTPDSVASAPVVDAAGNLTAVMTSGKFSAPALRWVGADRVTVAENLLPEVGASGLNAGPLSTAIDPSGKLLAYTYLEYTGTSSPYRPHLAIVDPAAPGAPGPPAIDRYGYSSASWLGSRLIVSDGSSLFAERPDGERLRFESWPLADGLNTASVSADGRRAVVGTGSANFVVTLSAGDPPASEVTTFCSLPDDGRDLYRGGASSAVLSPDGQHVAYAGLSGLRIARIGEISGEGAPCPLQDITLVSAQGGLPTPSAYTIPAPSSPPPPPPPPPGDGAPSPAPKPKPAPPKKTKAPTLGRPVRKGSKVTVSVLCASRCTYTLRLRRGPRTLSTRSGSAKAGRAVRVVLRGAKGRGLTVRLTVAGRIVTKKVA